MADPQVADPQAGAGTQPQAGTVPPQQPDNQPQGQAPQEVKDLPDWAQKLVKDLRKESGDYRTKLQTIEDKDKTEAQRLADSLESEKTRADAAFQKLRSANGRVAVTDAASKANAIAPGALFKIVRDEIEYDDDGEPTNVAAVLKAAQADYPELFRKSGGKGDGGETGAAAATGDNAEMNNWIRSHRRGGRG